ncbi:MAG: Gldg family protein, partial [Planctomycetota bacterium]
GIMIALVGLNLAVLCVLLDPVVARVDLTRTGTYTVSPVTKATLEELDDQVQVIGYLSRKTYETLEPLVPQLTDLLEEYKVHGKGNVRVEVHDPRDDEAIEREAFEAYGVKAFAVPLTSKHEKGTQSIYFHVVVAYAGAHEVIGTQRLLRVDRDQELVELGNVEYELTSVIRRLTRGYGTLERRVAQLDKPLTVEAFLSKPEELAEPDPAVLTKLEATDALVAGVLDGLNKRFAKGLATERHFPGTDAAARTRAQSRGLQGIPASRKDSTGLFFHLVVAGAARHEVIPLLGEGLTASGLTKEVEAALRRLVPGALPRVGIATPQPVITDEMREELRQRRQRPPTDPFQALRRELERDHEVRTVDLSTGRPPLEVDVLLVLRPEAYAEGERYAIDQYAMLGWPVLLFIEGDQLDPRGGSTPRLQPLESGLGDLLAHYGVGLAETLVKDEQSLTFPVQIERRVQGLLMRQAASVPYPWFLDVHGKGIDPDSPVISSLKRVAFMWPRPLTIEANRQPGAVLRALLSSSDRSWTVADRVNVKPELREDGSREPAPEGASPHVLAVSIEGELTSYFAGKALPIGGEEDESSPNAQEEGGPSAATLDRSVHPVRLAVISDADALDDRLGARILGGDPFQTQIAMVKNLIDWALLDEDLLTLRARGGAAPPLPEQTEERRTGLERLNYLIVLALLGGLGVFRFARRKRLAAGRGRGEAGAPAVPATVWALVIGAALVLALLGWHVATL